MTQANFDAAMSEYERFVWSSLHEQVRQRERRRVLSAETRKRLGDRAGAVADKARTVRAVQVSEGALASALEGLRSITMDTAMGSVSEKRVRARFAKQGHPVASLDGIRHLDLQVADEAIPRLRLRYSTATAAEGAATSLAITGAEVATTVSAGTSMAVVAAAIAVDTAAVLAALGRVVAETGMYYGFDVSREEEQLFALAIISYSSATTQPGKVAALAELSRLTQLMMRNPTWVTLLNQPLVKIIHNIYARLGIRLTKAGLGRAVPVAGIVVGAGLNAFALQRVARDAKMAYRMRFLAMKYGLDPSELVDDAELSNLSDDEDVITLDLPELDEPNEGESGDTQA